MIACILTLPMLVVILLWHLYPASSVVEEGIVHHAAYDTVV